MRLRRRINVAAGRVARRVDQSIPIVRPATHKLRTWRQSRVPAQSAPAPPRRTERSVEETLERPADPRLEEARTAYDAGDTDAALRLYEHVLADDPTCAEGWLGVSRVRRRADDLTGAREAVETALRHEPGHPSSRWHAAEIAAQCGDGERAVLLVRGLRVGGRRNKPAVVRIGRILRLGGLHEESLEVLEWARELDPANEEVLRDTCRALKAVRGVDEALRWLRSTVSDGPVRVRLLAELEQAADRPEAAWDLLAELPAQERPLPLGIDVMRNLHGRQDAQRAALAAESVLAADPSHEDALFVRALSRWRAGDFDGADTQAAALHASEDLQHRRAAIKYYLGSGRADRAWALCERIDAADVPGRLVARTTAALLQQGHVEAAARAAERALATNPDDPDVERMCRRVHGDTTVLVHGHRTPPNRVGSASPVPGRILHVVGKTLPQVAAGYTIRTQYVASCQRDAGLEPEVVSQPMFPWNAGATQASTLDVVDGIRYHRIVDAGRPVGLEQRLEQHIEGAAAVVRRVRPAVLHAASDYLNAAVALVLGEAFDIPVVYEVRGFWHETWVSKQGDGADESDRYQLMREREMDCARRADAVVTLAEVMVDELLAAGVDQESIHVVPNAVDPDAFQPGPRDADLAARHGIRPDDVVVGYISSFVPYEGIHYLVDAAALVPNAKFLLVGDGEERGRLEQQVDDLGLRGRVVLTGRVPHDEVRSYYDMIDVFVVPRTADRVCQLVTPLKPFEAMAAGKAMVVSDVPALRSLIVEGVTGTTFRPEDPEDLARVVTGLVDDKERRDLMGKGARAWVCEHRTWKSNGHRYLDLYKSLGVV